MTSKLQDYIQFKNGKKRPIEKGEYPVYGGNGILDYANDYNAELCIIVGRVGVYCGCVYKSNDKCWISDNAIYGINNEFANLDYFYYLLSSLQLNKRSIGSGQPLMTQDILNNIEVEVPDLETQQKIAKVLSAIDDKIELNNSTNNNLEQQAQAIFKSWFVDFEPFGGVMPDDWGYGVLDEIADITSGKRPDKKIQEKSKDIKYPVIGASSIMGYTDNFLYNERILVTGRVGTLGIVQKISYPCWTSDNTLIIKSKFYEYVYQILKNIDYLNLNRGSTQPLITQTDLKKSKIIIPNTKILTKFEDCIFSLSKLQNQNYKENERLTQLRDTLLPKLMSGEIDVSNVEIDEVLTNKLLFSEDKK